MSRPLRWADSAGVIGAVLAALCCAGTPVIVGVLAAVGLGWLRRDSVLWPLMFISLAVALWGLRRDAASHRNLGPFAIAVPGAVALIAGVVFVHGPPALWLIDAGAVALLGATAWNIWSRHAARMRPAGSQ